MIQLTFLIKHFRQLLAILLFALLTTGTMLAQTTHNINTQGNLTITSGSPNYKIVGNGTITTNRVIIESGYVGTITLSNVRIRPPQHYAPIRVKGNNTANVLTPVTRVNIILEGYNQLEAGIGNTNDPKTAGVATFSRAAALQVDRGAQIHISAIDPNDNASGELVARSYDSDWGTGGAAGIGGANGQTVIGDAGPQGTTAGGGGASTMNASGGNIIISSGTIFARGGLCGAGIGGGFTTLYPGHIVIFGGKIRAYGGAHSAGIGTGCPVGQGNNGYYATSSSIIALPPAQITATTDQGGKPGLAGANDITYVGDPQSPLVTVKTDYSEKNADIYADLTETTSVSSIFNALGITSYELSKGWFGNTGASGQLQFRATFKQKITFFTDAFCTQTSLLGRPFKPKSVNSITGNSSTNVEIILPILDIGMSLEATLSEPLEQGYSTSEALTNSYKLKITYTDANPLTGLQFSLQAGAATDFSGLKFYGSDGAELTGASIPTTLTNGMVLFVRVPIKHLKEKGIYNDVLRFTGTWKGNNIGYVRQVVSQRVVYDDSNTNTYIKVTASEKTFTETHPTSKSINLTLKISHAGLAETYNASDVTAKYLVTTEPNYHLALAANPLNTSAWKNMNIPANESQSPTTTVSFAGKAQGTYYIHWYVVSGVVYAHSLTVASPPRDNGGFGPYILKRTKINLSLDKVTIEEGGGAATGTAKLTAKLSDSDIAPSGGIKVNLTYTGSATRGTGKDYIAPDYIIIPFNANEATVHIVALADYLVEDNGIAGNEKINIAAPATVSVGSLVYDIIGSPLEIQIVDKTDGSVSASFAQDAAEPGTKGRVTFKLPGTGATAVSSRHKVKIEYIFSGAPATNNYTPTTPAEAYIDIGANSTTVDVLTPINNYVVEGDREVTVTIKNVTPQ